MKPRLRWLLGLAFVTAMAVSFAFAAGFSLTSQSLTAFGPDGSGCTGATSTVAATQDSYVNVNSATNFGMDDTLRVETGTTLGGTRSRTLVQFALPTIPAGCTLTAATLRLYNLAPFEGRTIQAFRIDAAWDEGTVHGNAIPATADTAATSTSPATAGYQTWTVTAQVQAMYAGNNYGFLVRDETESIGLTSLVQVYESRNAAATNDPQLVITWT